MSRPGLSRTAAGLAARRLAVAALAAILDRGEPLEEAFEAKLAGERHLDVRDRALARAILTTTLRRKGQLDLVLRRFLDKLLPAKSGSAAAILLAGAAQILFMRVPAHAAIDLAVRTARADRRAGHFAGLVNAVLRRVSGEAETILAHLPPLSANYPGWLWESWTDAYGAERTERFAEAHLVEPPLDLTVRSEPEAWARRLGGEVLATGTVRLAGPPGPVASLAGYDEGAWWVQDAAAALPARLLGTVAGRRVLDLCAAPGGKTAQLAAAGASVTALDRSPARLRLVHDNLRRLRLAARVVEADALTWQDAEPFDAVLLDAPCSATGTIRRHPDLPLHRTPGQVAELARLQRRLLRHAASLLAPGGTLVFATCSLQPEEGPRVVADVLAEVTGLARSAIGAGECGIGADWLTAEGELRTTPDMGLDGFYACRLVNSGGAISLSNP